MFFVAPADHYPGEAFTSRVAHRPGRDCERELPQPNGHSGVLVSRRHEHDPRARIVPGSPYRLAIHGRPCAGYHRSDAAVVPDILMGHGLGR